MFQTLSTGRWGVLLLALLLPISGTAEQSATHRQVDGMDVYIGVMRAEMVRGQGSPGERKMHGGVPAGRSGYHLVAALFDQQSGERVTDARVRARVSALGLAGVERPLETMRLGDAVTFGNYFSLSRHAENRIKLSIERGDAAPVEATFTYTVFGN